MQILYRCPSDKVLFDMDRFLESIHRYDQSVTEDDVKLALQEFHYDPMHVSVLVEVGVSVIKNEEAAKKYYDDHREWFDSSVYFERLRRITGYLVGSLERWNDGKKAEEKARVKHGLPGQYTRTEKDEIEAEKLANSLASQI